MANDCFGQDGQLCILLSKERIGILTVFLFRARPTQVELPEPAHGRTSWNSFQVFMCHRQERISVAHDLLAAPLMHSFAKTTHIKSIVIMKVMKENLQDETLFEPMACRPNLHNLTICCSNQESGEQTPCQSNQEEKENHKTQNDKAGTSSVDTTTLRDFRLFEQWVDKASGAISVYCGYSTPGLEYFNPDKHVFLVQVDFDYNQKNFRPIGQAPEIIGVDDDQALSTFQHEDEKDRMPVSTGVVKYKEYALTVPIYLNLVTKDESNDSKTQANADWMVEYYGQDQLLRHKIFNDIQLESSIFRHWSELEQDNRHKSYHHLMTTDKFVQFVTHAIHLPWRRRPRHKTSVVMVVITFGFALGQIESLNKFFVLPRTEALDNLEVWYHLTPKARKRLEKQCCTAGSSGRDDNDDSMVDTTIILLAHASRKMFVQHLGISCKSVPPLPPCVCDQKAKFYFSELQKQSPPQVDSPCLNEIVEGTLLRE